jgi:acetyl esterase/lipase
MRRAPASPLSPSPSRRSRSRRIRALTLLALLTLALLGAGWYLSRGAPALSYPHVSAESGIVRSNLIYCMAGGVSLPLDLYLPPPLESSPAPLAVYVHGGGWQEGDKTWIDRVLPADRLVARGYAVASVDYRLAPRYHWPAPIEDVKCAIRFLRAHAGEYHLDPERIAVWGESAGGHLVALLGLAQPGAGLEGAGYPDQSSRVEAVVDMCGPTDFTGLDLSLGARLTAQLLLGAQPGPGLLKEVSPISYVRPDAPPFLILHGDRDTVVDPAQSRRLYDALQAVSAPATLVMVKNAGHVFAPAGGTPSLSITDIDDMVLSFFDRTLRTARATALTIPQTGKTLRGPLLTYWRGREGRPYPGYPVSEAMQVVDPDGGHWVEQYFERAVLRWQPGSSPDAVIAQPAGALLYAGKNAGAAPAQTPNTDSGSLAFPSGGTRLGGAFLAYWQAHDGATWLGDPISNEFYEPGAGGAPRRRTQYFRGGALAYYPENFADARVLPLRVGALLYQGSGAPPAGPTAAP